MVNVLKFEHSQIKCRFTIIRAGIHIMLIRIANREDPDQTASIWVCAICLGLVGRQLVLEILEHLLYVKKHKKSLMKKSLHKEPPKGLTFISREEDSNQLSV